MPAFRIDVRSSELLCFFPYNEDTQDALKELDGQWSRPTDHTGGCWVLPIEAEDEVMAIAERAGYEVEVV